MTSPSKTNGGILGGQLQLLNDNDLEQIDQAALDILEDTGVAVHSEKAIDLLDKAGAKVDRSIPRAWLPKSMVEDAISKAPSKVELYGRTPDNHLTLEDKRVYLGTGGTTINVLDLNGERRPSSLWDCHQIPRLVDALENVHFIVLPVYPNELTEENVDVNRFYGGLKNSSKHIMGGMYSLQGAMDVIQMAEMIQGGSEALRKEPIVSFITLIISPLLVDEKYGDIMVEVAKRGIPLAIPCEPQTGSTSPITLAGNLTMYAADTLAGVTIAQLANPGTPVLCGYVGTTTDLRSMGYLSGSIESGLLNAGAAQLAQKWGIPFYATSGMSDSKTIDVQTGFEGALTSLVVALSGANYIHDAAGLMEFAMVASYEKYVIDNEIIGMVLRVLRGIEVNEETIAADLIKKVGPAGHFLHELHTVEHMRSEFYLPKLSNRDPREEWLENGEVDARQHANQIARKILAEHQPEPIPQEIDKKIRAHFDLIEPTERGK